MRIIGGVHKGKKIDVIKGLPVRPTTDFAKEALFNILNNKIDLEGIEAMDLFSGTGNIAFELASRGANVTAVDMNVASTRFITDTAKKLNANIIAFKSDVFKFLATHHKPYDLIFADPPYELENINEVHQYIFTNKLLKDGGWLIIEHGFKTDLSTLSCFFERRKYGNVNFSFFTLSNEL